MNDFLRTHILFEFHPCNQHVISVCESLWIEWISVNWELNYATRFDLFNQVLHLHRKMCIYSHTHITYHRNFANSVIKCKIECHSLSCLADRMKFITPIKRSVVTRELSSPLSGAISCEKCNYWMNFINQPTPCTVMMIENVNENM